ncbi:unnamed protein product [Adineta steineri]|uniref:Uncharacterized protein n=1 Tax=Adineta steineri TaxID=433720 RepID=A0A814V4J0_9BILA|nr:unnamed protein product [Adineta steineri]CAF1415641.1 unnamed protein product [Adineta steineri]CAF1579935.1 unnamed protein product [Adineta steineri]
MEQESANLLQNHARSTIVQSRSIRSQKKLCKIFSNKYIAQCFIPTRLNRVLNNLHRLAEGFLDNNQDADRLLQKIIKSGFKFHVLYRNRIIPFSPDGRRLMMKLRDEFILVFAMIVALNYLDLIFIQYSLQRKLQRKLRHCQQLIRRIIGNHLTQKSHDRIDFIFDFISDADFLAYIFDSELTRNHAIIEEIIDDLRALMSDALLALLSDALSALMPDSLRVLMSDALRVFVRDSLI